MINWKSNVFPGILGRTCDRPCEPACRRGRVEEEPVAICRLKRVAADFKDDISDRLPRPAAKERQAHRAGRRRPGLADRGARPRAARLSLRRLRRRPQGRRHDPQPDPALPPARGVIDEEVGYILDLGVEFGRAAHRQPEGAAGRGLRRDLRRLRRAARPRPRHSRPQGSRRQHPYRHRLAVLVSFGHIDKIGKRVIVLGGGNTAMDCCRSSRRLGGEDVKVIVRSGFEEMKASPWEKEDAMHEDIPILNFLVPKEFTTTTASSPA
jgi:formate dehydrogenase (NADP+) beta subunit